MNQGLRLEVLERDRWRCRGCSAQVGELHHIKFRSQGGLDEASNLITLCPSCHRRAHGTNGRQIKPEFLRSMILCQVWGWESAMRRLGETDMFVDVRTNKES